MQAKSNQVRITAAENDPQPPATKDIGNQSKVGPNEEGTGVEGVPTAIALSKKRVIGLKVNANFNV